MEIDSFSRIDKLFVDQKEMTPADSFAHRAARRIEIACGPEVAVSLTAQAAVLTALRTAERCYPGGAGLNASPVVRAQLFGADPIAQLQYPRSANAPDYIIAVGTVDSEGDYLQVSFDGWTAQVGSGRTGRLAENDLCPLAGVLAGALAVSETFMHFAGIDVTATRRTVRMSLWEPGNRSAGPGPALAYVPSRAWLAGVGHLGQGYAWTYSWLMKAVHGQPELWLIDDERVSESNLETGVLNVVGDLGQYKTRMASAWLGQHDIRTRMLERRIDASFKVAGGEPRLILGGFDKNQARHYLSNADATLVDAGIGNHADNFDTFVVRSWPNDRTAEELWPTSMVPDGVAERLAHANPAYRSLTNDACGRVQLAERAVGVPFVGVAAAAFAWAQVLRDLHGGIHVTDLKVKLSSPGHIESFSRPPAAADIGQIEYVEVKAPVYLQF